MLIEKTKAEAKTKPNRQQYWHWGSASAERCIEDQHNAPITEPRSEQESEEDGSTANITNNKHQHAGNDIGAGGARALSEALKVNTTLQSLNLRCEQEESGEDG